MGRCRNPRRGRGPQSPLPGLCAAFGAGIFLSLFCSLKLVVILAAVFLIVLGVLAADC